MSRTPASHSFQVVRGSTWEDALDYEDEAGLPVDLTGYSARMHVRSPLGRFGTTTTETLVMELDTTGTPQRLFIEVPPGNTVPNRVRINVSALDTIALNPLNARKVKLYYSIELFIPTGASPEYVIPLATGGITCIGEVTR